jgi:amino acid permease
VLGAKEAMKEYQESAGRFTEVLVGFVTSFISLIFMLLIALIVKEASLSIASVLGSFFLALLAYWFGQLSFRLIFNKPKPHGGLLSPIAIKVGCVVFGICSVLFLIFGIIEGELNAVLSAAVMLPACWYGWQLACKRQKRNGT